MKVAITIEAFDPARGGGETYARNFSKALVAAGHDVHVFSYDPGPPEDGITLHKLKRPRAAVSRRYAFAMGVRKHVQNAGFDIIHGFGKSVYMDIFRPGGGVHRAWLEQELKACGSGFTRFSTSINHKVSLDHRLVLKLEKMQFMGETGPQIIAVSNMVKNEIKRFYDTPDHRLNVIYNGVNLEKYHPKNRAAMREPLRRELGLGDNEIVLLFSGHNFKRKGLRPLISALPMLHKPGKDFRLVILGGDNPYRYRPLVEELKVREHVQYAGASGEPEKYYAMADIFVFPSYYDPCANVCLEALAAGLPVVTSTSNGSGELITQGREGYVVDADDTEALADCIQKLFDDDHRAEASAAARKLAETRPISRNFNEIMQIYDKIIKKKNSSASNRHATNPDTI